MTPADQQKLLEETHREIARLASLVDAPSNMLPQSVKSIGGTWLSLEWREALDGDDEDGWYLSLMRNEDGHDWELAEVLSEHPDYLLYVLFDEITMKLAKDAVGGERMAWFRVQEALLSELNDGWRDRTSSRHDQILKA